MNYKMIGLTKVAPIINESVNEFEGEREFLKTGNLNFDKIISLEKVTYENKPSRANQNVQKNDLILAKMKDTVKVLKISKDIQDIIVSTGFFVLRPKEEINPNFLEIVLKSSLFQNKKDKLSKGATQKAINNSNLGKIKIPLPPIPTQIKIAAALDKAQELIDKRKEQIKKYDELLQSVFLDMFGDPVTNPKGWDEVKSKRVLTNIIGGLSLSGEEREIKDNELGVLKISAVTYGKFNSKAYKVVEKSQVKKEVIFPKKGDLLFSRANTRELVGATCIVDKDYNNLFLPDKLWRLDLDTLICNPCYYKFLLSHKKFRNNLTKVATGTSGSMLNISKFKLNDLEIPLPAIELQNKFASIVEKVEEEKKKLDKSLTELEKNFNSIIQRAFRGELF